MVGIEQRERQEGVEELMRADMVGVEPSENDDAYVVNRPGPRRLVYTSRQRPQEPATSAVTSPSCVVSASSSVQHLDDRASGLLICLFAQRASQAFGSGFTVPLVPDR